MQLFFQLLLKNGSIANMNWKAQWDLIGCSVYVARKSNIPVMWMAIGAIVEYPSIFLSTLRNTNGYVATLWILYH